MPAIGSCLVEKFTWAVKSAVLFVDICIDWGLVSWSLSAFTFSNKLYSSFGENICINNFCVAKRAWLLELM